MEKAFSGAATLTPYLALADARRAIDWYGTAFDAELVGEPIVMPDARIGHAELRIFGARLFVSDAHPEIGVTAPDPAAGSTVTLHAEVSDIDGLFDRACESGAVSDRSPEPTPHGRIGVLRDPFGHRWMLNQIEQTGGTFGSDPRAT